MLSPRLFFAVFLTVNAVLFAKSRYGHIHPNTVSLLHGEQSLVKRISYELLNGSIQSHHAEEVCSMPAIGKSVLTTIPVPTDRRSRRPAVQPCRDGLSCARDVSLDSLPQELLLHATIRPPRRLRRPNNMAHLSVLDAWNQRIRLFHAQSRNDSDHPRAGRERRRSHLSGVRKRQSGCLFHVFRYAGQLW